MKVSLNNLRDLTFNAEQISGKNTKNDKGTRYEPLLFVQLNSEKWIEGWIEILRLIYEVNMKNEIDAKLKTISNWSAGIEHWEEKNKSNSNYSVPDEIYGEYFELCKIPTLTLKKVKDLENKIHTLSRTVRYYQKVKSLLFLLKWSTYTLKLLYRFDHINDNICNIKRMF